MPRDVCTVSGVHCALVMYCKPGGQPGGVGVETLEQVSDSGFHWMGLTIISFGMIVSGSSQTSSGDWRWERASALTFLGPGREEIVKLMWVKNSTHLACRGSSLLASGRYCRFLWSVRTVNGCCAPSYQCLNSSKASLITFSHFADTFPKLLTIGEYIKRFILMRQTDKTDRGSARNTKSQTLF